MVCGGNAAGCGHGDGRLRSAAPVWIGVTFSFMVPFDGVVVFRRRHSHGGRRAVLKLAGRDDGRNHCLPLASPSLVQGRGVAHPSSSPVRTFDVCLG